MDRRGRRRRLPVSCQLCRSMKLRCDPDRQPCQNCITRRVTCEKESPIGPVTSMPIYQTKNPSLVPGQSHEDILARLQRLEDIVLQNRGTTEQGAPDRSPSYTPGEDDTKWLEGIGSRGTSDHDLAHGVPFRKVHIRGALSGETPDVTSNTELADESVAPNVWLPHLPETAMLLERYVSNIAYLHHVVHIPTLRRMALNLHRDSVQQPRAKPSHIALVLSVFASTAHMLSARIAYADSLFTNQQDALKCASIWTRSALDVLEYSSRSAQGSLEDIQATIILSFVIFNLEGFTPKFRALNSKALTMAKDLHLHRIDAGGRRDSEEPVELEVRRRIWWQITSTDWLLALSGGPQEGTYLIHPKHMCVNLPSHADDIDLAKSGCSNLPTPFPTSMTYFHLRVRLAEICRTVVDTLPAFHSNWSDWRAMNYGAIVSLDERFTSFLNGVPLVLDLDKVEPSSDDADSQYSQLVLQQCILSSNVHSRRFKLNQRFMVRLSSDRRYAYSRNACLRSARAVIDINRQLKNNKSCQPPSNNRLTTFLHTFFLATAVLVMDLCINKAEATDHERQEVAEACQVFKEAEAEASPVASKFLRSLMDVLQKYRVQIPPGMTTTGSRADSARDRGLPWDFGGSDHLTLPGQSTQDACDIDALWRDLIDMNGDNPASWDSLFSALDAEL